MSNNFLPTSGDDRETNIEQVVYRVLKKRERVIWITTFAVGVGFSLGYNFALLTGH
jgi:hypothetical protein